MKAKGLRFTRRRVLVLGLFGLLAILLPWRFRGYRNLAAYQGLRHFSPERGVVLASVIDAILPDPASGARTTNDLAEHVRFLDRYLTGFDAESAAQIGTLLIAIEHLTLPFGGQVQRFSSLSREQRREVLDGWRISSIGDRRLGYRALVGLTFMSHYRTQDSFDAIGYTGPVARGGGLPVPGQAIYDSLCAAAGAAPAFR